MVISDNAKWTKLRVLDGGFGSELEASGFPLTGDPLWSARALIERPDLVVDVHKRFILAGSDVILTNSYHANIARLMLDQKMTKEDAVDIVKRSVDLANKAVMECENDHQCAIEVVGSVGSYATALSDCSEYNGHYVDEIDESVLVEHYIEQSHPLLQKGLTFLAYETIPALLEVKAILNALDRLEADFECWISLSCKDGEHTNHGDIFKDAAKIALSHPKVRGIGINCTPAMYIGELLKSIQPFLKEKPAIVYPNSGEAYDKETRSWIEQKNLFITREQVNSWQKLGVKLVGGCCRVNPTMISTLVKYVNELRNF